MICAHIKNYEDSFIGTINKKDAGFRIVWRERMENHPGNIHSVENELYPTIEKARQGVYRSIQNAQIIEV